MQDRRESQADLGRFVVAQDAGGTYDQALRELVAGEKRSHWMWFVFPQLAGLGRSAMAQAYALSSLDEARSYAAHPVLGPRLRACVDAVLEHADRSAEQIFGGIDALKLRSSMTLFARADPAEGAYGRVLGTFYGGVADPATEELIEPDGAP